MKVLLISSLAPSLLTFRLDMIRALQRNGHEVIAIAPEHGQKWESEFKALGIAYYAVPIARTGMNPLQDIRTFLRLIKYIHKIKPDLVFAYQAKSIVYGCVAAKLTGVNRIYALVAGLGSILHSNRKSSIKAVIVKLILKLQYKLALACCKRVFFQNPDDRKAMRSMNLIRADQPALINGSGVNLSVFTEQPLPDQDVFLFVGRLLKDKGIREYMEAARLVRQQYPQARCLVLGPFDTNPTAIQQQELQCFVEDGSIEYMGATDDVRPYLKQCSVLVLPSYHEGTPRCVLEAMATGRPIITTDAPGCRETVVDQINGFLVPPKDTAAIAEKMIWMIENREQLRWMSQQSLRMVRDKYDVNKVNQVIMETMQIQPMEAVKYVGGDQRL
ncbi:glycosyltransferase family 4 protein [Paenibacillus agilis]|uniref:Glycosyltransferase family 4 protein n=1 Tax=Paenibacillus agilis TaxID=3020863 RepID=A0A559J136_9BACL|nr:glycosyltransferase family 4 protein [Paenibacillus agilis]TVX93608.1 glycosyltransferase family 4 protein [Paenibacillus agilis]